MKVKRSNLRITWRGLLLFLLSSLLSEMLLRILNRPSVQNMKPNNKDAEKIYTLLIGRQFSTKQARFIVAQAAHETAGFTSNIYKENNNCFGMKLALVRKTTATGENKGHAAYRSIEDCIEDFKIYFINFQYLPTYQNIETYVEALKRRGYFEDSQLNYLNGCEYWYKKIFTE